MLKNIVDRFITASDVDPEELRLGIQEEAEHDATFQKIKDDPDMPLEKIRELVARDHLVGTSEHPGDPNYYTKMKK